MNIPRFGGHNGRDPRGVSPFPLDNADQGEQ